MSVDTHCLPTGSFGTDQLPVPNIGNLVQIEQGTGPYRGVIVSGHGWNLGLGSAFPSAQWISNMNGDGWVLLAPPFPEDTYGNTGFPSAVANSNGIALDWINDPGAGARYLASWLHTWDHTKLYIEKEFGNWPLVALGISWGGWHMLQTVVNRTADIVAYLCHISVVQMSALEFAITQPYNWTTITSDVDITSNSDFLNSISLPGMVGWSNPDTTAESYLIEPIVSNAIDAGQPISTNPTTEGHIWSSTDTTTYTEWITSTVDPLCPAVH